MKWMNIALIVLSIAGTLCAVASDVGASEKFNWAAGWFCNGIANACLWGMQREE